jgi:5'-3' exonuclease
MGVADFSKVFGVGEVCDPCSIVLNEIVAIDMSIQIHTNLHSTGCVMDDVVRNISILIQQLKDGKPKKIIAVFDNPVPNPRKAATHIKRHNAKQRIKERIDAGESLNQHYVSGEMVAEAVEATKELCDLMDIEIHIPEVGYEAEHYASTIASVVVSNDTDCMFFGAKMLLMKKALEWRVYFLEEILSNNNLEMERFREICVALGTDFCPKVRGIGKQTVMKKSFELNDEQLDVVRYASISKIGGTIVPRCEK